jgi:LL-diaminopimelate aminotransferase
MARINQHYQKLAAGYLFPEIARRVRTYQEQHPEAKIIRLGIGDVVLPLADSIRTAMHRAIDEMGTRDGFRGYGPEQGYDFLREAIAAHDFKRRGVDVSADEIFVSDGSKCDSGNIQEIFSSEARVAVPDPVYPVYVDTNVMAGRTGPIDASGRYAGITYLPCTEATGFCPEPPREAVDLVYLCFPNNPTGAVASRGLLADWVRYAQRHQAIILFDAAYEAYITDPNIPHSIFEITGARDVAIELRSFSKSAGFTGTRCAYIIIPKGLKGSDPNGAPVDIGALWMRRHTTKFNGVSYPVQAGAAAVFSERGQAEVGEQIRYYLDNAAAIRTGLAAAGAQVFGGVNAPYVWVKTPSSLGAWELFDRLLERAQVVVTPGAGFGACGEGYFRVSAFGQREQITEAIERIRANVRF